MTSCDLHVELFADIFSYLGDYKAIVLVCHAFHALALPMMYRSVDLVAKLDGFSGQLRLSLFLRSLINRPELGNLVRRFTAGCANQVALNIGRGVDGRGTLEENFTSFLQVNSSHDMPFASVAFPRVVPTEPTSTSTSHALGFPGTHLMYSGELIKVLQLLPRLRYLHFIDGRVVKQSIALAALGMVSGGVPIGLNSIESLELHHDRGIIGLRGYFRGWDVVPLFRLPALSRLTITRLADGGLDNHWEILLPETLGTAGISPVEHLALYDSNIHP